jgi:hypothetical protein
MRRSGTDSGYFPSFQQISRRNPRQINALMCRTGTVPDVSAFWPFWPNLYKSASYVITGGMDGNLLYSGQP